MTTFNFNSIPQKPAPAAPKSARPAPKSAPVALTNLPHKVPQKAKPVTPAIPADETLGQTIGNSVKPVTDLFSAPFKVKTKDVVNSPSWALNETIKAASYAKRKADLKAKNAQKAVGDTFNNAKNDLGNTLNSTTKAIWEAPGRAKRAVGRTIEGAGQWMKDRGKDLKSFLLQSPSKTMA